jgi:hypothetical protein
VLEQGERDAARTGDVRASRRFARTNALKPMAYKAGQAEDVGRPARAREGGREGGR